MSLNFQYDNKVFSTLNKLADCIVITVLWLLGCLPVITIGTSTTAMYYAIYKTMRCESGYLGKNFWSAYKSNLKQTTKIWFIMIVVFAVLIFDLHLLRPQQGQPVVLGICYYLLVGLMSSYK